MLGSSVKNRFQTFLGICCRVGFIPLPSPVQQLLSKSTGNVEGKSLSSSEWLKGLRGILAFIVFISHFSAPYQGCKDYGFGYEDNRFILQLPIVRLIYFGKPMVPIFYVVAGYVLSLHAPKRISGVESQGKSGGGQEAEGESDRLLETMSSLVFRRWIRLFLPPIISTFCVMLGVQLRFFDVAYGGFVPGFALARPDCLASIWSQIHDWAGFVLGPLTTLWLLEDKPPRGVGAMPSIYLMRYGVSLYVIPIEYRCSIVLFVVLLGLSRTRWRVRLCLEVLLFLYCQWYDRWDVASFIGGLFLAELDRQRHASSPVPQMNVNRFRAACHSSFYGISLIAAFFLLSTPELQAGHTPGFMLLSHLDPTHSRLHSLGALLLVFALARMPSAHFLFNLGLTRHLGNISYALYLVHELVLHILGWPAVPAMWRLTGQKTAIQYQLRFYLAFLGHHIAGTLGC